MGNLIFLPEDLCPVKPDKEAPEIYDDIASVISTPAFIVKVDGASGFELNYFRSVGWGYTFLMVAVFEDNRWKAVQCLQNPPIETMNDLLVRGKLIRGKELFQGL